MDTVGRFADYRDHESLEESSQADPDSPRWSARDGLRVWLFSIVSVIVLPLFALAALAMVSRIRGESGPGSDLESLAQTPRGALIQVISTVVAHVLTLAICLRVVMRASDRHFAVPLGLRWPKGSDASTKTVALMGSFSAVAMTVLLASLWPLQTNLIFGLLLSSSNAAQIATILMIIVSAPLAEEIVYRGVLFGSVRRCFGNRASTIIVALLFALVHVPQYSGSLALIAGITVLSFTVTYVRATTKAILPGILIHAAYNASGVIFILLVRQN